VIDEKQTTDEKEAVRVQPTDPRLLEEGALGQEFNAEAQASQGESAGDGDGDGDGDDGNDLRKSWKARAEEIGQRRGRGRGLKMERDGE
jgi:hypothetical protein